MLADAVAASVDDGSGDVLSLAEAEGVAAADLLGELLLDCADEAVAVSAPLVLADAVAAGVGDGSGDVLSLAEAAGELLGEVLTLGETAQTL